MQQFLAGENPRVIVIVSQNQSSELIFLDLLQTESDALFTEISRKGSGSAGRVASIWQPLDVLQHPLACQTLLPLQCSEQSQNGVTVAWWHTPVIQSVTLAVATSTTMENGGSLSFRTIGS